MGDRERADADPAAADAPADAPAAAGASAGTEPDASADADTTAVGSADADPTALAGADDPLVVFALATFNTGLLVAILVVGLYLAGPLGELLDGLRTSLGLGLYLALWATTWWTNRRWLDVVADLETDASASIVVGAGGKWGGVNGVAFFWALFSVTFLPLAVLELDVVPALFVLVVGSLLALGIGAILGALFAALDLVLFGVADRVAPEFEENRGGADGGS